MAPEASTIEQALRQTVRNALKAGDDITVNIARSRVEAELDLDEGFFKTDSEWKAKSKEIISATVEEDVAESPQTGSKRKSPEQKHKPQKRAKKQSVVTSDVDDDESAAESKVAAKESKSQPERKVISPAAKKSAPSRAKKAPVETESSGNGSDAHEEQMDTKHEQEKADESDMSSVIDDPPPRKKRQKKDTSEEPKKAKNSAASLSPDEEMVKTLQSQLVKCGVRKLWHRELASCKTPKDKIRHLRQMLTDIGMTGRFSTEKATQIKEARELAADLESAREFDKTWGTEAVSGRGRRSRTTKNMRVAPMDSDDDGNDDDEDNEDAFKVPAGRATGLVDFGDSGDEGSD